MKVNIFLLSILVFILCSCSGKYQTVQDDYRGSCEIYNIEKISDQPLCKKITVKTLDREEPVLIEISSCNVTYAMQGEMLDNCKKGEKYFMDIEFRKGQGGVNDIKKQ